MMNFFAKIFTCVYKILWKFMQYNVNFWTVLNSFFFVRNKKYLTVSQGSNENIWAHKIMTLYYHWRHASDHMYSQSNKKVLNYFITVFGGEKKDNNNRYLINPKCTEGLMSLMDTFLLTITCRSNIVLVSSTIEKHLGHCRVSCIWVL